MYVAVCLFTGCIQVCFPLGIAGCTQALDDKQLKLHEEAADDSKLFAEVLRTYAKAADNMAAKKHDLQQQLIAKTSDGWKAEHTNKATGEVTATAQEWDLLMQQRDLAMKDRFESEMTWRTVGSNIMGDVDNWLISTQAIFQKDVDVYEAKKNLQDAKNKLLSFAISTIAGGAGIGSGIAIGAH